MTLMVNLPIKLETEHNHVVLFMSHIFVPKQAKYRIKLMQSHFVLPPLAR